MILPFALLTLSLFPAVSSSPTTSSSSHNTKTLKQAAGRTGRYFGAALGQPHLQNASDPLFARTAAIQFSGATPENEMKWESTEPTQGHFTFHNASVVVDFAKQHGMSLLDLIPLVCQRN